MTTLQQLENNRRFYSNLAWQSSSGVETFIINMDDDYILNVLRNVGNKLFLASQFPLVEEFQSYNGIAYQKYADALYNEYQYRIAVRAHRIEKYAANAREYLDYLGDHSKY